jgi:hypothetical protein
VVKLRICNRYLISVPGAAATLIWDPFHQNGSHFIPFRKDGQANYPSLLRIQMMEKSIKSGNAQSVIIPGIL